MSLGFFAVDCDLVSPVGSQHEIVTLIKRVLRLTAIDFSMFERWCNSSSNQFRVKNMNGLAYENISDISHDTQCDALTILQIEKRNKQAINLLSNELSIIKESGELVREQNNDLSNNLKSLKDDVSILLQLM